MHLFTSVISTHAQIAEDGEEIHALIRCSRDTLGVDAGSIVPVQSSKIAVSTAVTKTTGGFKRRGGVMVVNSSDGSAWGMYLNHVNTIIATGFTSLLNQSLRYLEEQMEMASSSASRDVALDSQR
jgi:hypothetical protein